MQAVVLNALIRCTRSDQAAQSAFELVSDDLGLWVRELPEDLDEMARDLSGIRPLLKTLGVGASDYTLHLAATIDESRLLVLPPALTKIAGNCGFSIEVVATTT